MAANTSTSATESASTGPEKARRRRPRRTHASGRS
jgi:hypothetical protein